MYGWEYLGDIIQGCREIGAGGCQSTTAVTSAMVDAVFSRSPKCRYLIHGGRHSVDKWAVSTLKLQWLELLWPVYHGCFEFVLESKGKIP